MKTRLVAVRDMIDLRSDTVTLPSPKMREAVFNTDRDFY